MLFRDYLQMNEGLIGRLIWNWNISFSNSKMTRHLLINNKVLIVQKYLLEFNASRKVLTIQEFSSDDLMDAREPPLTSHIFYIKSKIVINWLICCLNFDISSYFQTSTRYKNGFRLRSMQSDRSHWSLPIIPAFRM